MTRTQLAFCLLALAPISATAQTPSLTGRWVVTADFYGTTRYARLDLTQQAEKLTGKFNGDPLEGTLTGNNLHVLAKDNDGDTNELTATLKDGTLAGKIIAINVAEKEHPLTIPFTATLVPPRPTAPPQRHEFTPTVFYRQFSPFNKPVLTVNPGDTIHTTTVDAGGNDEHDIKRVAGGNPQTGPFYIQSAAPGDTLVVHIVRLRLNRPSAGSDDGIVQSALNSDLAVRMKDTGKSIPWSLDLANGTASPRTPSEHLAHYTVPLRPMLGCIATAPGPGGAPPPTGDSGNWGGNMDFNEITEGATVYLPVSNPGALLYLGDAHALQGDGELNGNALETSMDVEFTVDVIPNKRIPAVRVESPTHIMATGYSGYLDDAFKDATNNMAHWLADDYKLTPSEIAQVLGTASEYRVSEVADRNSGIVLKISKDRLATLTK
ncbi:MAG TPA: acetamidase/formamidase family protein [Edaphobacter sp.]|nr:acetamidase/formamidase family protein [Edaphobacter sp.]